MKHLLTGFFLLLTVALFAQPINDDCDGLVNLGIAPSCDSTLYNNVGATPSDIGLDNIPTCWANGPERDVWIAFEASDTINDYLLTVTGCPDPDLGLEAMLQPQIAVYRGDCEFDGLQLLACGTSNLGEEFVELELIGLTPGLDYFIRIQDWSSTATPNDGAFKFCVIEKPPVNNVCAGSSTLSSGTLSDSGGPDGDYANDENCVFTICPDLPHECLIFDLQYYNLENNADNLNFYDGPDNSGAPILSLTGQGGVNSGGVCQTVTATSGCMTIEFITDIDLTFEGFLGTWETSSDPCEAPALIVVDDSPSESEIVQSVIEGNSLITLTDIDCPNGAMGIFDGTGTDLGLDRGMLLTTGSAIGAANSATTFISEDNFANGDNDLDSLSIYYSNGSLSEDACVVEMEVLANSDQITFEYIFGSEEYPAFVNSTFNDIFGLLASGPGITGDPFTNNQQNVGVLGDGTFVEINTVNFENNWQFYRDNTNGQSVVYGGLTSDSLAIKKSLTATVPTIPCETYKLKFAIADRGDGGFDSGVFVGKINSGTPEIGVNFLSGIEYLAENCTPMAEQLVISFLGEDISQPVTYNLTIDGTAELGIDYTLTLPPTVTFVTGTEEFIFEITPIVDAIQEGEENIIINITQDFGCGETVLGTVDIPLFDDLEVEILDDLQDTVIICEAGTGHQMEASGAVTYMWEPAGIFSDPTIANPIATPTVSQWVTVTGTTDICSDIDSVYLEVVNPEIEVLPENVVNLCEGDSIVLEATNNVNNSNLQWQTFFFFNFDDPNDPIQTIIPDDQLNSITLTVSVELDGCVAEDVVNIFVDIVDEPELVNDTTICQNYSVDLGEDILNTATIYSWTPDIGLDPGANVSGPLAIPDQTTTYQLISNGALGQCSDTSEVTITVIPSDVEIQGMDTTYICLDEPATLTANTSTAGVGLTWSPDLFLTPDPTQETVVVNPPVTTWYYATLEATAECTVFDSVLVWVDSIPNLEIMADPMKDSYCQGEEILLTSPVYEPANFPDIDFTWLDPMPGSQTPDSFLNLVTLATVDNFYIRESSVNACLSVDSIFIDVVEVADFIVNPPVSTICQGESVQLNVESSVLDQISEFSWTPSGSLSCSDCTNPVATPNSTTTYQLEAEFDGCPVGAMATVNISEELFNGIDGQICPGESYQLNNVNVPGATFSWTSSDGTFTSDEANPVVSPTATTTYNLVATSGDCTVEGSVTVIIAGDVSVSIDEIGVVCPSANNEVTLNATTTGDVVSIVWFDEDGNPIFEDNPLVLNGLLENTFVTVEVSNGCPGGTDSETYLIEVSPQFSVSATADPSDTVTAGTEVTLTAVPDGGVGLTYSWSDGETDSISTDISFTVTPCTTTTYTVTATDENDCTQAASVTVPVTAGFAIDSLGIVQGDTTYTGLVNNNDVPSIFEGQEFQIIAWSVPHPVPGGTYEWIYNDSTFSINQDTISSVFNATEVDADTEFPYGVNIIDPTGCEDDLELNILVLDNPVRIPNVFTPNGDGVNDVFNPVSQIPVTVSEFKIWNRWGQLVYDNETPNVGWDGMQNDENAISDVYVYRIVWEITGGTGAKMTERGDVTLLR